MLMDARDSALMLIDAQAKLMPLVTNAAEVEKQCRRLCQVAQYLNVPIITTEQYPKGLGKTITALQGFSDDAHTFEKTCFSAVGTSAINQCIHEARRKQLILIGIETHVCILQTAIELMRQHHTVFVVESATASRDPNDKKLALKRMRQLGVQIVSPEMVIFEWLVQSGSPEFKHISQEFIK